MATLPAQPRARRDHMARVFVSDEVWAAFREAAYQRHVSVASYLGNLMDREVTRHRAAKARAEKLSAQEAITALEEVKGLRQDLDSIAQRLEWAIRWSDPHGIPPAPR